MRRVSGTVQRALWLLGLVARSWSGSAAQTSKLPQAVDLHAIPVENFVLEYDAMGKPTQKHFAELAMATADFIFIKLYDFYDDDFVGFDIDHIEELSRYEVQFHGEATFSVSGPSKNSINMHIKSIFAIGPAYLEYIVKTLDNGNPFATSSEIEYVDMDYADETDIRETFDPDYELEVDVEDGSDNDGDIEEVIYQPKSTPTEKDAPKSSNIVYGLAYSFAMVGTALLTIFVLVVNHQRKMRKELNSKLEEGYKSGGFPGAHTIGGTTVSDITPPSPKSPKAYSEMDGGNDAEDGAGETTRLMLEETLDWPNGPFEPVSPDDPRLDDLSTSDDTTMESLILNI